ncbi:MAG: S1 RNA-binding domain-containing protein [Planctomycetota bacterium]
MSDESTKPEETPAATTPDVQPPETSAADASTADAAAGDNGPLNLSRIRELRQSQQKPVVRPKVDAATSADFVEPNDPASKPGAKKGKRPRKPGRGQEVGVIQTPAAVAPKVEVPSVRQPLAQDLEDELSAVLGGSDLDNMLIGDDMLQVGHQLTEGQRISGRVLKTQGEFVFVSLGGPNEGNIPSTQFEEEPEVGSQVEVIVRGYSNEEGLYELTLPGNAVDVSDWDDINEGEVIEVVVSGSNTGGLECKAGSLRGFIPASQVAEYRVENLGEMVGEKVLCLVTEANERRGNLVLSRRAVLEREKQAKREERLASISVGDSVEGTVTKILDFGAFVDIGGLDGLLHISQLSWERVNHPSEILEQGQKVQVRIDKIDEQSGKIGLSYRSLQEHPWADVDDRFPVGSKVKGTVSRIAEFGAFVKVATGVEGLVHISELAHHRVSNVGNVVQEGQEIEVKVLSIDESSQRMSLSIKAALAAPAVEAKETEEEEVPPAKPVLPKHQGPLKGGKSQSSGGEQFGLKW